MDVLFPVKRLQIPLGQNEKGQMVISNHVTGEGKKVSICPGKYARIETGKTVIEVPLGPLGWEYEV
jgi:hypothetical protein